MEMGIFHMNVYKNHPYLSHINVLSQAGFLICGIHRQQLPALPDILVSNLQGFLTYTASMQRNKNNLKKKDGQSASKSQHTLTLVAPPSTHEFSFALYRSVALSGN